MKNTMLTRVLDTAQTKLYEELNEFSFSHEMLGRFCSIPVSLVDVTLETFKMPLAVIEHIVLAAIHLVGAAFCKKYKLKKSLDHMNFVLLKAVAIPFTLLKAPIQLSCQIFYIIEDPLNARSCSRDSTEIFSFCEYFI